MCAQGGAEPDALRELGQRARAAFERGERLGEARLDVARVALGAGARRVEPRRRGGGEGRELGEDRGLVPAEPRARDRAVLAPGEVRAEQRSELARTERRIERERPRAPAALGLQRRAERAGEVAAQLGVRARAQRALERGELRVAAVLREHLERARALVRRELRGAEAVVQLGPRTRRELRAQRGVAGSREERDQRLALELRFVALAGALVERERGEAGLVGAARERVERLALGGVGELLAHPLERAGRHARGRPAAARGEARQRAQARLGRQPVPAWKAASAESAAITCSRSFSSAKAASSARLSAAGCVKR